MTNIAKKHENIQIIRGMAIILVIIQHYHRLPLPVFARGILNTSLGFWSGVDIFFAISGFLICQVLFKLKRSFDRDKKMLIGIFILRRAFRLLPSCLFWVMASFILAITINGHQSINVYLNSSITAIAGYTNLYWVYAVNHGAFSQTGIKLFGSNDFNGVTWSLSLEWQLYLFFSTIFIFRGYKYAICGLLIWSVVMLFGSSSPFTYAWSMRSQAYTLGFILYPLYLRCEKEFTLDTYKSLIIIILGLLLCLAAGKYQNLILVAIGATLCLYGALQCNDLSSRLLSKALIWIGDRYYSIYLTHLPLMLFIEYLLKEHRIASNSTFVLIMYCILLAFTSSISYYCIEEYFIKLGKKLEIILTSSNTVRGKYVS